MGIGSATDRALRRGRGNHIVLLPPLQPFILAEDCGEEARNDEQQRWISHLSKAAPMGLASRNGRGQSKRMHGEAAVIFPISEDSILRGGLSHARRG